MEHAPLSASGSPIWTPCPGSVVLGAGVQEEPTTADMEGTAVHWNGEDMLLSMIDRRKPPTTVPYVGMTAPNGVIITQDMADCAMVYYRSVMDVAGQGHVFDINVERRALAGSIHEHCWGTPDAWVIIDGTLYLFDYKNGHASVVAEGNTQFIIYARLIIEELRIPDTDIRFDFRVIQPNCYDGKGTIRRWTGVMSDLRGYVNKISASAHEALGPNPQLKVGPHCHYCKARHLCPALQEASSVSVDYAQSAVPREISGPALAYELMVLNRAKENIDYRKEALEAEAHRRLTQNKPVPGWVIEQGYGHNKWVISNDDVFSVGDLMGVDLHAPDVPLSPRQAQLRMKEAGVDPSVLDGSYKSNPTSMKLKFDDGALARRVFNQENKP